MFYGIKSLTLDYIVENNKGVAKFTLNKKNQELHFSDIKISYLIIEENNQAILKVSIIPQTKIKINGIFLSCELDIKKTDTLFLNGYQSWTQSKEFNINEKISPLNKLFFPIIKYYRVKNFGDSSFFKYPNKKGHLHGYSYTYIRTSKDNINFIGSLNEKFAYTIFEYNTRNKELIIRKDIKNKTIEKEIAIFEILFTNGDEEGVFNNYFEKQNISKPKVNYATGWTSWYNYYVNISQNIILQNLDAFKKHKIPIDFMQIDDGYQQTIGDWLDIREAFPNGMKYIADKIKETGIKPGIWIAPFVCQKKSKLFKNHPDWIVKTRKNKPFKLGYSKGYWDDSFYPLDFYNPQVRQYIKKVLSVITDEWGYEIIKIDFLYALTFIRREDKPRATILYEAVSFLRECIGKKFILGCGTPLAPVWGIFDYCRIGSDVALQWEDILTKDFIRYRERVSCANSLESTIGRRHLNNRGFLNDPDVYILREENNKLTADQKFTLYILNQIFGGLVFTSDNIQQYNDNTLRLYMAQFPFLPKENIKVIRNNDLLKITFSIKTNDYTVYSNLSNKQKNIIIENSQLFFCNEFINGNYNDNDNKFVASSSKVNLRAYQTICFLNIKKQPFSIVGSNLHIFPGSEVKSITNNQNEIKVKIDNKNKNKGYLFILVPEPDKEYIINSDKIRSQIIQGLHIVKYLIQ